MSHYTREPAWDDLSPLIDEAIASLPDRYKVVILSHYFERQSHQSIAQNVGLARRTVTYRIQRGLELIRKRLKREGMFASAAHLGVLMESQILPLLPTSVSHGIGRLLISSSVAPSASNVSLLSTLSGGGWSMFAKISIAALVVTAPFVLWKTSSVADPPAAPVVSVQSPALNSAPTPPLDAPAATPPEPLLVATNQQDQESAPTEVAEAGATISGRIFKSPTGEPVVGQKVKLLDMSLLGESLDSAVVGETESKAGTGIYLFSLYPPGRYAVVMDIPKGWYLVAHSTSGQLFEMVEVLPSENQYVVDVELTQATATLTGTLLIGGKPAPDTSFDLSPFRSRCDEEDSPCVTDSAGRFRVDAIPPFEGDLQASIDHEDGSSRVSFLVPVWLAPNATSDVAFDFSWGTTSIEGGVYRQVDGKLKPLTGRWEVIYSRLEPDPETGVPTGNMESVRGETDADGTFLIESLKPGRISLTIYPSSGGSAKHRATFDIAAGVRYVKDFILGESAIKATVLNKPPTTRDFFLTLYQGNIDPFPVTPENVISTLLHFENIQIAMANGDRFEGLMPGTYTVIAASWPCPANAASARAMGEEFFYTFGVARAVVNITGYKQTVNVTLDNFRFVPRP